MAQIEEVYVKNLTPTCMTLRKNENSSRKKLCSQNELRGNRFSITMFFIVCSSCILGMAPGFIISVFCRIFCLYRKGFLVFRRWKRSALTLAAYFPNVFSTNLFGIMWE